MTERVTINKKIFMNYINLGISVIPCAKSKKALVSWEEFQRRLPTEEDVDHWFKKFPKIDCLAMITGTVSGVAIIDIDFPVKELKEGSIYNKSFLSLKELVDTSDLKLVSNTPRGGSHYWFKVNGNCPENTVNVIPKIDFRGQGGYAIIPPSIAWDSDLLKKKVYQDGKYTFETDFKKLSEALKSLDYLPEKFINLLSTRPSKLSTNDDTCLQVSTSYFEEGQRDNDLFKLAMFLADGNCPVSFARQAVALLSKSIGFNEKEAQAKVDSAMKRYDKKHGNLSEEIKEWVLSTNGNFLSTDIYNCLQVSTRDDKKNVSIILSRLVDEGVLEKDGKRNGKWRKLETDEEIIDLNAPDLPKKKIWLPCGLHNICYFHPKNIMIVAGVSETGKTAWLLNIAKNNTQYEKVYYFSSEMGGEELKFRLKAFKTGIDGFKKVKFLNRGSNFEDVIRPDDINIIDFLEIHEEHYRIGVILKRIYDKLRNGIAIIAIQKDAKKEFGVGGNVTQEKARIYVNLDHSGGHSTATIVKGKNWVDKRISPNKRKLDYWVIDGAKIKPKGNWYKEGEQDIIVNEELSYDPEWMKGC